MKNTKTMEEIKAVLTAIFAINRTGSNDTDISLIIDYAFRRLLGGNTNLLILICAGKTKDDIMPEVNRILEEETQYKKYLEDYKK